MRKRPDRAAILDEWILATVEQPLAEQIQTDGRIRRWRPIPDPFPRWTIELFGLFFSRTASPSTTHSSIEGLRLMKAKYFKDTDTLYLEFRGSEVVETRDLDQDTLLDYDDQGMIVGITIEHATSRIGGPGIELETVEAEQ